MTISRWITAASVALFIPLAQASQPAQATQTDRAQAAASQATSQVASPAPAVTAPYSSFVTNYRLERGDSYLGTGTIKLAATSEPGCHVMEQTAVPRGFLRWITGDVVERSEFCVRGGVVRTSQYRYHRDGAGAGKENFEAAFDWSAGEARIDTGNTIPLTDGVLDKLNVQAAIRAWIIQSVNDTGRLPEGSLKVEFVDKEELESYEFAVRERAVIEVPAGRYATVRVDRIDRPSRRSQVWLSPEHGYIVVKAEQQKRDDPTVRLLLTDAPVMP